VPSFGIPRGSMPKAYYGESKAEAQRRGFGFERTSDGMNELLSHLTEAKDMKSARTTVRILLGVSEEGIPYWGCLLLVYQEAPCRELMMGKAKPKPNEEGDLCRFGQGLYQYTCVECRKGIIMIKIIDAR